MLLADTRWVRRDLGDGAVLYTLPDDGGQVRCQTGQRPLRPLRELVPPLLAAAGCVPEHPLQVERLYTREGEFAACCEAQGRRAGAPAWIFIGVVFGDETYSLCEGLARVPGQIAELRPALRSMLLGSSLGLGVRRRRFYYLMPQGWHALASGPVALYYPPQYPRDLSCLTVFPANPGETSPATASEAWLTDEMAQGFALTGRCAAQEFKTAAGLLGQSWRIHGTVREAEGRARPIWRSLFIARCGPYLYSFLLDCGDAARRETLEATLRTLIESVEPLAHTGPVAPRRPSQAASPWAD